jgi:hypothetical protein
MIAEISKRMGMARAKGFGGASAAPGTSIVSDRFRAGYEQDYQSV